MSKESGVTASSASPASSPTAFSNADKKLASARCSIATPLGLPVDPEV
jgi:hypothetical protein